MSKPHKLPCEKVIEENIGLVKKIVSRFNVSRIDKDDLINNVAYNGTESVEIPNITTTIITPEENDILEGDTQTFTITRYINGNAQNDEYEFSVAGVPPSNYAFNVLSDNSFSIENIKAYEKNALTISCYNKTTKETTIIDIWLVGGW